MAGNGEIWGVSEEDARRWTGSDSPCSYVVSLRSHVAKFTLISGAPNYLDTDEDGVVSLKPGYVESSNPEDFEKKFAARISVTLRGLIHNISWAFGMLSPSEVLESDPLRELTKALYETRMRSFFLFKDDPSTREILSMFTYFKDSDIDDLAEIIAGDVVRALEPEPQRRTAGAGIARAVRDTISDAFALPVFPKPVEST